MQLVIVESPTKAKTIGKFLGRGYKVQSSYGHIRDLPKSKLGIDVKKDFEPEYVIIPRAKKNIQTLKDSAKKADSVLLSTDPDREGEAIAFHLAYILGLEKKDSYKRIVFHEITKSAIEEALKNPRTIDMNLVNSQQARRILDRLVGYKLSPFLWKKIARKLSAGRVQSVAVRLIVEREREIQNFVPQEYWTIEAILEKKTENKELFSSQLVKINSKNVGKLGIKTKKETDDILKDLEQSDYKVADIVRKEIKRNPFPPFTTSTLQQDAWQKFRFPAKFTMQLAQNLYEKGFITYHRTDSLNLSESSLSSAKKFITENFGENYWAGFPRRYKAKGRVQEAHEAIRPTYPDRNPESLNPKDKLEESQSKLYDLIWKRFIASQMAQAIFDSTRVEISASPKQESGAIYGFQTNGSLLKFDGFLKIYPAKFEEIQLPILDVQEELNLSQLNPNQHFTQPPPRYTEATLIKALEADEIGRPSTYAPIIANIQERNYVEKDEKKSFQPTEIGYAVNDMLVSHFPEIVDIKFTAHMEEELDEIAQGKKTWTKVLENFYTPFEANLNQKYTEVEKQNFAEETTDKKCPQCGSPIVVRLGKFGKFYACSTFPKCKYTESLKDKDLGIKCPKCKEGNIVEKRTKRRKIFYGCSRFPECDFALWDKPINENCPKCGSILVRTKRDQIKCSNKECEFVK